MVRLLSRSRFAWRPRRAVLAALALGLATLAAHHAAAQDLPIRPTDAPGDPLSLFDDDTGLRGTALGPPDADATAPAAPIFPEGTGGPPGIPDDASTKPPRPAAGQGSALMAPRVGPPPLPTLSPYPTSQRLRGSALDTIDQQSSAPGLDATTTGPSGAPTFGPTVAALPAPPTLRRRVADDKPFEPIGYTVGTLRLTPYVEQSLGFDSNPDQTATGVKPSAFSRTEGGFSLLSLWSSNELKSEMHAGYDAFFSDPAANRPDAAGTIDYRYTVSRDIVLDAEGRFVVTTQRAGSPDVAAGVQGRPLVDSTGATLGGSDTLGRLTLGLHGLFDRSEYEDGRLADGSVVGLSTENYNDYGLALRADYAITPTLKPFGEVTLDSRVHDTRLDLSGYARDSDGVVGKIGTAFELTPLIVGTVDVGYADRSYTDRRLKDLRGPVVDASIAYAITPLTTLTLLAGTSFDETTLAGSSGAQSHSVSLTVSHALLRNLTLTGILGYLNTDYVGSPIKEDTYSATLKASYNISRSIVLEASYNHETLRSTDPTSSFDQDIFSLGLRLQH